MADLGADGEPEENRDVVRFVAAAGVLAVMSATLPGLHYLYLHYGIPSVKQVDDPRSPAPRDTR